jgi:hypothetical protein
MIPISEEIDLHRLIIREFGKYSIKNIGDDST